MSLPKGTVIELEAYYDNSAENPANPSRPPSACAGASRRPTRCACWGCRSSPRTWPISARSSPCAATGWERHSSGGTASAAGSGAARRPGAATGLTLRRSRSPSGSRTPWAVTTGTATASSPRRKSTPCRRAWPSGFAQAIRRRGGGRSGRPVIPTRLGPAGRANPRTEGLMRPVNVPMHGLARHRDHRRHVVRRAAHAGLPPGRPYVLSIKGDNTVTFRTADRAGRWGWTTRRALRGYPESPRSGRQCSSLGRQPQDEGTRKR